MGCGASTGKENEAKQPEKNPVAIKSNAVAPVNTALNTEPSSNPKPDNSKDKKNSVVEVPKEAGQPKDLKSVPLQKPKPVYEPPKNLQLFIILGSPFIGKSVQAGKLVATNDFAHIVPEQLISHEVEAKTKLGQEIEQAQKKGQAVPASTMGVLIEAKLKEIAQSAPLKRVVLENFPKNKEELSQINDKKIASISTLKTVLLLTSTEEHCVSRLLLTKSFQESAQPEEKKEAQAKAELQSYNQALKPVLDFYEGIWKLQTIDAKQPVPRVFRLILKTLIAERTLRLNSDQKPDIIYVIGGPSSGKTTQCNRIRSKFKVNYLFIGDLLRDEMRSNSQDGKKLREIISQGQLIPSEYPIRLLKPKIAEIALSSRLKQSILIDGFPFALDYIETWSKYRLPDLSEEKALLYLDCSDETLKKRNKERSMNGAQLSSSRAFMSNTDEILTKRLESYKTQMKPLVEHFDKMNQTAKVNGDRSVDEVYFDVEEILMPKVRLALAKRPNILFIFGGPGAGKGTHSAKLSNEHGFISFSTKKLLEDEAKQTGELGIKVKAFLDKKEEVPENLIVDVIRQNIIEQWGRVKAGGKRLGFIIDGFPKNLNHVQAWNKGDMELVGKIKTMINLDSSNENLLNRIKKAPPKDYKDLNDEQIMEKIQTYKKGIAPVIDLFTKKGILHLVDADGSTEDNYQEILELLRHQKYI